MRLMLRLFLLLKALLCLTIGFQIEENSASQRLPSFLGHGYDLMMGNPYSDHTDKGFKVPIFDFTYKDGQTTDDEEFLIPDHTYSRRTISCSLSSKYN